MRGLVLGVLLLEACDRGSSKAEKAKEERARDAVAAEAAAPPMASGSLGGETTGGLAALAEVGPRLIRAVDAYRAGQDVASVLAPFAWEPASDAVRLELEHAHAEVVTHLGFELELLFFEKGRGRY